MVMSKEFRISRDVRYRIIDDEAIVVRQREGDVLVFNQVASRMVQLVGEGLDVRQIGTQLADEFDAPEATIRQDVDTFFDELENLQIIEEVPAREVDG
jgi:hypothetical protein